MFMGRGLGVLYVFSNPPVAYPIAFHCSCQKFFLRAFGIFFADFDSSHATPRLRGVPLSTNFEVNTYISTITTSPRTAVRKIGGE